MDSYHRIFTMDDMRMLIRNKFSQVDREVADLSRALSHPARVQIIKTLAEHRSCVCGEIVKILPLAQSTVSQHLREIGIIRGEVDGSRSCYCIDWKNLQASRELLDGVFEHEAESDHETECC